MIWKFIKNKKRELLCLKIVLSAGILYYLFKQISFEILLNQFSGANVSILFFALIILFIQCGLSALKWKIIITAENNSVPFLFLLKNYLIGNFISLFLPSSFGGDIYRVISLKKYNLDFFQNASSVLFDRISGLFALSSISIVSFVLFYKNIISYEFIILYLSAILLFWILSTDKMLSILSNINIKLFNYLLRILKSFHKYRNNIKVLFLSLIISFIFQSNIVLLNKLYCLALNINIDIRYLYMVVPIIYLTEALPISINGLGVREGAFVFFFLKAGYTNEEALAVALLVITMRYLFSLTIGGSLFARTLFSTKCQRNFSSSQDGEKLNTFGTKLRNSVQSVDK